MLYFVYKLVDCRREDIRAVFYIGVTDNPNERFEQHLRCDDRESEQKNVYVRDMLAEGTPPRMEIIEIIDKSREKALDRELFWIQDYARQGAPLLNDHHHRGLQLRRGKAEVIIMDDPWDTYFVERVFACHILGYHGGAEPLPSFSSIPQDWLRVEWIRDHSPLFWLWGTPERSRLYKERPNLYNFTDSIWANLGLFPLEEPLIHRLLRKELDFEDLQPDNILPWATGRQLTGYITSALYREGRQQYQSHVFQHALVSLAGLGVHLKQLYLDVSMHTLPVPGYGILSPSRQKGSYLMRLAKEHYFSPLPSLSESAWVLDLKQANPSRAIQAFQRLQ